MVCTRTENTAYKICRCSCRWRCMCIVPRESKSHPPFNSGLKSRVQLGLHPKLYPQAYDSSPIRFYEVPKIGKKCFVTR